MSCRLRRSTLPPLAVQHVDVDEMRPRIDAAVGLERAAAADDAAAAVSGDLAARPRWNRRCPGVNVMADLERAHDRLEQIASRRVEAPAPRPQRCRSSCTVDRAAFAQAEDVDASPPCRGMPAAARRVGASPRRNGSAVLAAGNRWSWMLSAPLPSNGWAPKSAEGVSGMWQPAQRARPSADSRSCARRGRDAAQEEAVVVVLAAQELLVVVELARDVHLVAGGAELRTCGAPA